MRTTYKKYRDQRQKAFDELPICFAYSDEQFRKGMEKLGLKESDTDKVYRLGNAGFYRKTDSHLIKTWCDDDKLPELMQDYDFCKDAVLEEMKNHEYGINWQGDWDVMSCFGKVTYVDSLDELKCYFDELGWTETQRRAYMDARREYNKLAEEHEWF